MNDFVDVRRRNVPPLKFTHANVSGRSRFPPVAINV